MRGSMINVIYGVLKPDDKDLSDLINKLILFQPAKRMNLEDYFSHLFFKKYNIWNIIIH